MEFQERFNSIVEKYFSENLKSMREFYINQEKAIDEGLELIFSDLRSSLNPNLTVEQNPPDLETNSHFDFDLGGLSAEISPAIVTSDEEQRSQGNQNRKVEVLLILPYEFQKLQFEKNVEGQWEATTEIVDMEWERTIHNGNFMLTPPIFDTGQINLDRDVNSNLLGFQLQSKIDVCTAFINICPRYRDLGIGRCVFIEMEELDLAAVNAMSLCYAQHDFAKGRFHMVEQMQLFNMNFNCILFGLDVESWGQVFCGCSFASDNLDIDSFDSIKIAELMLEGIDLKNGRAISTRTDYRNDLGLLKVFMSHSKVKPSKSVFLVVIGCFSIRKWQKILVKSLKGVLNNDHTSLIRVAYGGWHLYLVARDGDLEIFNELFDCSSDIKLWKGGLEAVHIGVLHGGREIADSWQGSVQFQNELVLSRSLEQKIGPLSAAIEVQFSDFQIIAEAVELLFSFPIQLSTLAKNNFRYCVLEVMFDVLKDRGNRVAVDFVIVGLVVVFRGCLGALASRCCCSMKHR